MINNGIKVIRLLLFALGLCACADYTDQLKVFCEQPAIPVLTLKEVNPVLKTTLVKASPGSYVLREVCISLQGTTDLSSIESISLFPADANGQLAADKPVGQPQPPAETVVFRDPLPVETDTLVFWVSMKLKDKVDLTHRVNATCQRISTDLGRIDLSGVQPSPGLRTGVALRQHNQDGVHTARIPGLATSAKGTLLAIYDARYKNSRDLQGDIDIALQRSTDGGQTWQPLQVVLDQKEWGGLPEKYNGVSDACILVDEGTNDIYVAGLWMYGVLDGKTGTWAEGLTEESEQWQHQWQGKGSQPGWDVKQTAQFLITKSTDDGLTWSDPVNITAQNKKKEWWLYAPAPGHGITLSDGTLVFPTQGRDKDGLPFSNITWSKDKGKTWTTASPAYEGKNTTECMAVQLSDGSIMLNMRDNRNRGNMEVNGRRICVTTDLGLTWTEHPTSRQALIEPTCMASIHKHTCNGKSFLLFCNPASHSRRDHITLKASFDDGKTWPSANQILLDEYSGRGYSCITSVNDSIIGILYEGSQADLIYQQIQVKEIKD